MIKNATVMDKAFFVSFVLFLRYFCHSFSSLLLCLLFVQSRLRRLLAQRCVSRHQQVGGSRTSAGLTHYF